MRVVFGFCCWQVGLFRVAFVVVDLVCGVLYYFVVLRCCRVCRGLLVVCGFV